MATQSTETRGAVEILTSRYDTGLVEVTFWTPSRSPGGARDLRAVIEQDVAGAWVLLAEHPSHDVYYRTLAASTQAGWRRAQAAYEASAPRKEIAA